ncbi:MAG: hypothetical protein KGJ62_00870 [Armatimonadetes bacterium]|nr:hypothetical protein [Armatimonadota bacterium]MDE2205105.1 hypothetical protein [Armatimonadota bacterium]
MPKRFTVKHMIRRRPEAFSAPILIRHAGKNLFPTSGGCSVLTLPAVQYNTTAQLD